MSTLFDDDLPLPEPPPAPDDPGQQPRRTVIDVDALLEGLNPQQRAAVVHEGSPVLVVAGAGSGKTRVHTSRIAYLLAVRKVSPGAILAITFTNKAAGEMRERVAAIVGPRARRMWVMTFHSACVRILREQHAKLGFSSTFSIYDMADAQRLIAQILRQRDLDPSAIRRARWPPRSATSKTSWSTSDTYRSGARQPHRARAGRDLHRLPSGASAGHAFDFDDLIMTTVHLLQGFPDVAEHYRRRFRHVMVDDTRTPTTRSTSLVRELVGGAVGHRERRTVDGDLVRSGTVDGGPQVPPAELCVVGDADQAIYAFRGATIRNILEFEADYPDARAILLEQTTARPRPS